MSVKSKVFAGAATLTLVGGAGAIGAMASTAANAATPSCGGSCIDIYSPLFGTHASPNFALDVYRQGAVVGQPVIMFRTSNSDPALDFTIAEEGTVAEFNAAGLVSDALDLQYSALDAFEIQYTPDGVDSGLCVATTTTAGPGAKVGLEACGVSSKSVWVLDTDNPSFLSGGFDAPWINGSDTNFSDPYVLTYPANAYPTDKPRPQLETESLTGSSHGSPGNPTGVEDSQLFGFRFGVLN